MTQIVRLMVVPVLMLLVVIDAKAAPIIFTYTGTGSGTIGGASFSNAEFVLTATGDTANRLYDDTSHAFLIPHDSASILIGGVGMFDITTSTKTFVNTFSDIVGFSMGGIDGLDLYNSPVNAVFGSWDMLASLGPVVEATFRMFQWGSSRSLSTDAGLLNFDGDSNVAGSFEATVIPEPTTLALLGVGVLALRHRRGAYSKNCGLR